jgi:hypothetical protein
MPLALTPQCVKRCTPSDQAVPLTRVRVAGGLRRRLEGDGSAVALCETGILAVEVKVLVADLATGKIGTVTIPLSEVAVDTRVR